ncbi:MAG: hypothetical protein KA004_04465 [Verrucomicrobiales bacterium]|nr:hypothetical protein [Verrucomicrobiales bacterium]
MNPNDYTRRQARKDAEYEQAYRTWIKSLPADERRAMEAAGLDTPSLQRHGNGAADSDLADSAMASHTPDMAALLDEPELDLPAVPQRDATDILRHFVADMLSEGNTRLTVECLAVALGLSAYNGESMTDIARRHGISRAAVSKRCVDITQRLNLPPSRAMRSELARRIYRRSQLKRHRSLKS